jgi:HEAT repeat protein
MVNLVCSQCQTTLPVPEERLGKAFFVCPACAFPLEAPTNPSQLPETVPLVTPPPAVADPIPELAPIKEAGPRKIRVEPVKAPPSRRVSAPRIRESEEPAAGNRWLLPAVAAGVLAFVGVGGLMILLNRGSSDEPEVDPPGPIVTKPPGPDLEVPKELVDVLAVSEELNQEDASKRIAALLALGKAGAVARPVLPALIDALKDDDAEVRVQAQAALDRVGPATKEDLPILSLALGDDAPEVRAFAAGAVGQLGMEARDQLPVLCELVEDGNAQVSAAAQKSREQIEKQLLTDLTRRLKDDAPDTRRDAARELGEMGPDASSAIPSLTQALGDDNAAVRQAAADALVQMGPEAVPVLVQTLTEENAAVRIAAVSALGRFGPDAQDAVPALMALTVDPRVGLEVRETLIILGVDAVPAMVRALAVEHVVARQNILIEVLVKIGAGAVPALEYELKSQRPEARDRFNLVLDRIGPVTAVKALPEPTGKVGEIYRDLHGLFEKWDHKHRGYLDRKDLERVFRAANLEAAKGRPGVAHRGERPEVFLKRLDRNGDGRISKAEYEHWARGHAEKLHDEHLAREKLEKEHARLKQEVKTTLAHTQAEAVKARKEAEKRTREVAEAKDHAEQQEKAHKEAEHRVRELAEARKRLEAEHKQAEAKAHAEKERKARLEAQRHAEAREKAHKEAERREKDLRTHKAQAAEALRIQQQHAKAKQAQEHAKLAAQQRAHAASQHRAGYQAHVAAVDRHVHQQRRPPPPPPHKKR